MNVLLASLALAATTTLIPLNDLGPHEYLWGWYGGLWDEKNTGDATIPADHLAAGLRQAAQIEPRDSDGNPDPDGKIAFLSIGYGNTRRTFEQFQALAEGDSRVNHQSLVLVNAAGEHLDAKNWDFPWRPIWANIEGTTLAPAGVTPQQVQVVWIQQINENPFTPLPIQYADSYLLKAELADTLRTAKQFFPNLQVAYLSSPEYAGYDTTKTLREPFAFEDGFAPRWVILGQIEFMHIGYMWDPRIGDLSYTEGKAPWATWGPYLWANGTTPRSDGLTWARSDFLADGFTLSEAGARKSAGMLMKFLVSEPTAAGWFMPTTAPVPRRRVARH